MVQTLKTEHSDENENNSEDVWTEEDELLKA